jgi:hypothetical protein
VKRFGKYRKKLWNDMENMEGKVSQIMVRYGQYGRKACWNVKWYGKYGRKASRRVIIYGQHRRKLSRIVKK